MKQKQKNIILISKFPLKNLNEGTVKQITYHKKIIEETDTAKKTKNKSKYNNTKITLISPDKYNFIKRIKQKTDYLHLFGAPSIETTLTLIFSKYKKSIITIYDGDIGSFEKNKIFMKLFKKIFFKKIDLIITTSKYQKELLLKKLKDKQLQKIVEKKIKIIPPILIEEKTLIRTKEKKEQKTKKNRREKNRILYMSSIKKHKGITLLLYSIKKIIEEDKINIKVVIANSNFSNPEKKILDEIKKIKKKHPKNIILKGTINPEEELKKAEIYFYVFKKLNGTFGVPLSLIEAEKQNTKYLSSKFKSLEEYFEKKMLVKPKKEEVYKKLKDMLKNKKKYVLKQKKLSEKKTIQKLIEEIKKIYE